MSGTRSGPPEAGPPEPGPGATGTREIAPSDADLVAAVREGDTGPFGVLYERHHHAATGLARQLVTDRAGVEDVVADTFTKVLDAIRRGHGPSGAFRPYLLTAVRRSAYDRFRDSSRQVVTDDEATLEVPVDFEDPALADLERNLIARAFNSLPERWQVVLWHTEVEDAKPADVAPLLGISANGVAALAYRAREGLRQAYLQEHLASGAVAEACREHHEKLGGYVRGGLAKRAESAVGRHLEGCDDCSGVVAELAGLNEALRGILGPIILGPAAAGYLASVKAGGWFGSWVVEWWQRAPKQQQAMAAGAMAAVLVAGLAFALVSDEKPPPPPRIAVAPPPPPQRPEPKPEPEPQPPPPEPEPPRPAPPPKTPAPEPSTPAPTPTPPPTPTPTPTPAPPAKITVRVEPVGALVPGRRGIVAVRIRHAGGGVAAEVEADVRLPRGVLYRSVGRGGRFSGPAATTAGDGWVCRPGEVEVGCVRGPLRPGATSTLYLGVEVGPEARPGEPPSATVRTGRSSVRAAGRTGVVREGMPARYATDGRVRTVAAGNALLTCPPEEDGCAAAARREGPRRDNDMWDMTPVDADDRDDTRSSSSATLRVPAGGRVRWAGLYWSGGAEGGRPPTARLRGPGGAYETVRATETGRDELPGYPAYQAFADVTEQIRDAGGGTWWVADTPAPDGRGRYAGWVLMAVVEDPRAPYAQAMVLDGVRALYRESAGMEFPLAGMLSAGMPGELSVVAWEGDAGLPGDEVVLGGRRLTPETGERESGNVLDGSAAGAEGPEQSFGTDVDRFRVELPERPALRVTTETDAVLTGVVGVTARMRS